ncbi:hypothetical protein SAMN04487902_104179 [Prevotella sp. ne3005]|uniref:hypothetical protein n=1 Tax=Prevotella sp. ne3005 TaxID=1761887 RepID=UPI0008BC116D|nr:hypothetical protein [Prevotella sp. ne3005]SEM87264.1 hypothetical protein SAMN04487902_104179 [Prevotella sp. ne3005]
MKKYLMTGVAAVAFAATLTSCSKAGDLYDEGKVEEQKIASVTEKYDDAFIKAFGQPAANQDWGFASRKLPASFGAGTRTSQTNSNQWGTNQWDGRYLNYPKPADITPEEREAVLAVFNQKGKESYKDLVNLRNFFVQQVYCGPNGSKMNQLACVTNWVNVNANSWPEKWEQGDTYTDDEVNNFNTGKYSGNAEQGCMLMFNSSTSDWSFKTSQSGGQRIYGHWRMEKINGNYYVGLDHEAWRQAPANANEEDKRDFIYNDWIIKIVPGVGTIIEPERYTVRIICEDLMASNSSDFDFNDVVFDASYVKGQTKTYITVKAAGGTIPLYIEGNEVHKLFQDQYPNDGIILPADGVKGTMINTRATGGVEVGDATLIIDRIIAPWDIAITINNGGTTIPLKAEVGSPAAKIAVNPSFDWLDERADITKVCPNFSSYVQDTTVNWY